MSEEAGIQVFGPDNVAIQRVRIIVISISGPISMILLQDTGYYEITFHPDTKIKEVIKKLINFNLFSISGTTSFVRVSFLRPTFYRPHLP